MSAALFVVFVVLAVTGILLQVRSRGQVRGFAIGSALVLLSLPVFAVAYTQR